MKSLAAQRNLKLERRALRPAVRARLEDADDDIIDERFARMPSDVRLVVSEFYFSSLPDGELHGEKEILWRQTAEKASMG